MSDLPSFRSARGRGSLAAARAVLLASALAGVPAVVGSGCDRKPWGVTSSAGAAGASASSGPSAPAVTVPRASWDPGERQKALADGRAVLERNQCNRCHQIEDIPAADRPFHCTSCHVSLKALRPSDHAYQTLAKRYGEHVLQRYQRNIVHLERVPSLTGVARRVRPEWIGRYLAEPYDLRPSLEESMIRHTLSEADIRAAVRYFAAAAEADDPYRPGYKAPEPPKKPDAARLEQGKRLFAQKACTSCHTIGNQPTGMTAEQLRQGGLPAKLAINLRFVPERSRPDALVAWLLAPEQIAPGTLMPSLGLSLEEAEILRDYLFHADAQLKPAPAPPSTAVPAVLSRPVPYEEMKERVLGKVCVHCHMNDYEKDWGPGNKGGFGYQGVGLAMRTYETLVNGAVDAKGQRYSVLVPRAGEKVAPILAAMMRRRLEEHRDRVEPFADHERPHYPKEPPGMPMGLPSMTDEEVAILATWIAQGCQGPTRESGMAGVSDGYLVPDGPIKKNQGCELRAPEAKRPSWAVDAKEVGKPASSVAGK